MEGALRLALAGLALSSCALLSPDELSISGNRGKIDPAEGRFYEADTYGYEVGLTWYLASPPTSRGEAKPSTPADPVAPHAGDGGVGDVGQAIAAIGTLLSLILGYVFREPLGRAAKRCVPRRKAVPPTHGQ